MEAVYFDAGGVITRLEAPRPAIFREACEAHRVPLSRGAAEALFAEIRRLLRQETDLFLEDYPRFRRRIVEAGRAHTGLEEAGFQTVWADYRRRLQEPRHRSLYGDARPALETLADRGLRLGVISNAVEELHPLLQRLGVAPFFEVIVASETTGYEKPQAEIFRLALDAVGVRPEEAIHVGDSYHFDYLGATRAGLRALLLDRKNAWAGDVPRIRTLRELPAALEMEGI